MPDASRHYHDELQDWLDQRLDAATCTEVERHLETCAECRRAYEAMAWTKRLTAHRLAVGPAPEDLRERIRQSLRAASPVIEMPAAEPSAETTRPGFWRHYWKPALAAAGLILAAVLTSVYLARPTALPDIAVRDFQQYRARQLALELATDNAPALEAHFAARGVGFRTRVLDLAMMKYQLVGGRVQGGGDTARALFVYRGAAGQELVCQMFAGRLEQLPAGATLRENKGIRFQVYRQGTLTAVFWQEGAVVCVLVSDIEPEEVIQLSFAKAMP